MKIGTGKSSGRRLPLSILVVVFFLQTVGRITYWPFIIIFRTIRGLWFLLRSFFRRIFSLRIHIPDFHPVPRKAISRRAKIKPGRLRPSRKPVYYLWLVVIIVLIGSGAAWFYLYILKDLPRPDRLLAEPLPLTTKLYDRDGRLLYKIYRDQNRTLVSLSKIPTHFIHATIAIEDKHFFTHNGFSVEGFTRALKRNVFNQQMEGGSTITQQLIKNTILTPEKTLRRKLKELILSLQTELVLSKNQILEMYLNTVPYGGTAYGVEEAAQTYFGKSITDLDIAESALLAGLPAAPSKYSPFGLHPELCITRQHEVLRRMVEDGYLSPETADRIQAQKITLAPLKDNILAPHFVMYLKNWLAEKYGLRQVEQGGLSATSSLDLQLQSMAQNILTEELQKLSAMQVTNGAVLITRPYSGEILAMVGSKNYFDKSIDGNVNVTLQPRQPGSTIKIVNYAYALGHGYTAASIISDTPITYRIPGQKPYQPVNYDQRFHGNVTLRYAFASSYNVPAVKVLASYGVKNMVQQAQKMGITTWTDPSRYGLSLTLGGGEVTMMDLATVYGSVANEGQKVSLNPVLSVKDYQKNILYQNNCYEGLAESASTFTCLAKDQTAPGCTTENVIDPGIAFIISSILSDNEARTPAFGANSLLNIKGYPVAVKTGTTNDKRDNWCIGYTPDYLVAVWVGNNDNQPMSNVVSGITGATPIWAKIMQEMIKSETPRAFDQPANVIQVPICPLNGLKSCGGCPAKNEYFLKGTEPKYACQSEEVQKIMEEKERQRQNQILEGLSVSN